MCYWHEYNPINIVNIKYKHNLINTLNIIQFILFIIQKNEFQIFSIQQSHIIYPKRISGRADKSTAMA